MKACVRRIGKKHSLRPSN